MRKLTITYLEKMISKVLKENLGEKAETLVSKIKSSIKENSEVCEQCGGNMNEGECMECGYNMMEEGIHDVEDINNKDEFDYVQEEEDIETETNMENEESCKYHMDNFGPEDERTKQFCGSSMNEALKGRQRKLDKNKNNKIDAEDFKLLRKGEKDIKKMNNLSKRHGMEEQETKEGRHFGSFDDNEWIDDKDRIFNNDFDFDYDEEEFNDYPSFKEKHPDSKWFGGKDYFDTYKKHHNRPLKVRSRKFETDEGNAFTGALSKARKSGEKDFEVDGKKFETKEAKKIDNSFKRYCGGEITKPCIDRASKSGSPSLVKKANLAEPKKKIKESYQLTESEMISMIEKIVLEQKTKKVNDPAEKNNIKGMGGSPRGLEVYKKAHNGSGKENDDYIKSVTKKMKEYLKDGSKTDYDMNPKIFPKGNGELEKMKKTAYELSEDGKEFIDDY